MAPPGITTRTCGKVQAEAAATSAKKDNALLLAKTTCSNSTASMCQSQTKEVAKASKPAVKSIPKPTPKSTTKPATLASKPAAKPPKPKQTPSQCSTIPPTPTQPLTTAVVADNNFNVGSDTDKINDMQPSTQDVLIVDSDVDAVEDQDELSSLVESDQDDNYIPEEEAPLEQEDKGAGGEEEQVEENEPGVAKDGMDVDDIANIQLLEQQLAATKERMNNKRKHNVSTPTPATSQATMDDMIQAEHDVLDAHLKKKQKTSKTGLPSIDSIWVIHEHQATKGGYASTSAKNLRNMTLSHPSTNPAPTTVCRQSSLRTTAISRLISGSNISIVPSESGPSGTGSTGNTKDDQLSHYLGLKLTVITQTDSEALNQQLIPAIEKLLQHHISRARNHWKEAVKEIVENYYELSGYTAEIQEHVEYLTDKYHWTYGLLKLDVDGNEHCLHPFGHPAISSLIQKIAFDMKDGAAWLQSSVLELMPFATIALASVTLLNTIQEYSKGVHQKVSMEGAPMPLILCPPSNSTYPLPSMDNLLKGVTIEAKRLLGLPSCIGLKPHYMILSVNGILKTTNKISKKDGGVKWDQKLSFDMEITDSSEETDQDILTSVGCALLTNPPLILNDINEDHCLKVTQKSEGLFQWASVVCQIVQEAAEEVKVPAYVLEQVLSSGYDLYSLYKTAHNTRFKSIKDHIFNKQFKTGLGFVLTIYKPLSRSALSILWKLAYDENGPTNSMDSILPHLAALFNGTSDNGIGVSPIDTSVQDFFASHTDAEDFYININHYHLKL
ncbi:hypothetical protein M422DRAFT_253754 [Sphaerobolus stellatus SS14]|uniref:DUF6532 domain-containing protein n=1 Tax=Sphaerobolus stellatus (strain SS14) TaxID=990650 RepID=A0A0C9VX58_SPHS4|nr:hypothetical protein M422DRAFT_253754 [Sphaerobolus stellatus SS14]